LPAEARGLCRTALAEEHGHIYHLRGEQIRVGAAGVVNPRVYRLGELMGLGVGKGGARRGTRSVGRLSKKNPMSYFPSKSANCSERGGYRPCRPQSGRFGHPSSTALRSSGNMASTFAMNSVLIRSLFEKYVSGSMSAKSPPIRRVNSNSLRNFLIRPSQGR
jgi:hypothetical protein